MIRGIYYVVVYVYDMEWMICFYKDVFGFEVVGEFFSWEKDDFVDCIVVVKGLVFKGVMLCVGSCYMEFF